MPSGPVAFLGFIFLSSLLTWSAVMERLGVVLEGVVEDEWRGVDDAGAMGLRWCEEEAADGSLV